MMVRLTALIAVTVLGLACTSRERRPVTVQPAPQSATGKTQPQIPTTTLPQQQEQEQPQEQQEQPNGTTDTDSADDGSDNTPPDSDQPNNNNTNSGSIKIDTTLEDGSVVSLEWTGDKCQGNAKFDLQCQ